MRLFTFLNMSEAPVTLLLTGITIWSHVAISSSHCIHRIRTLSCTTVYLFIPCVRFKTMLHIQVSLDTAIGMYYILCWYPKCCHQKLMNIILNLFSFPDQKGSVTSQCVKSTKMKELISIVWTVKCPPAPCAKSLVPTKTVKLLLSRTFTSGRR